jgi:muramoyltetrapeptide carboxypeptidase
MKQAIRCGLVATSKHVKKKRLKDTKRILENLGYIVKFDQDVVLQRDLYFAGSAESRARELMRMYRDNSIDVIFALRGGYGSIQMLPHLDYDVIKKNKKPLVGHSDVSLLLNVISQRTGNINIHAPHPGEDSFRKDEISQRCLSQIIRGEEVTFLMTRDPLQNPTNGSITCNVIGGNLTLLIRSMGHEYEVDTKGKVLFLEEVDEDGHRIYDMLTQLHLGGKLSCLRAIVLGRFKGCNKAYDYIRRFVDENLDVPTFYLEKFGHGSPNYPFRIGAPCEINPLKRTVRFSSIV